jgi:outer membrane lipoprotein-sorting protein
MMMLGLLAKKGSMIVMMQRAQLLLVFMTCILSGCLALRTPLDVTYTNGAVVDSLSSNVTLAYSSSVRSISGSGIFMFRKPDHIRAVTLSPFGSVLQEVYISGEQVTIIDTGNGTAFSGTQNDLNDKGIFNGWRYIQWAIDIDPPDSMQNNSSIERINKYGQQERASFKNGLLISKVTAEAGHVTYGRYTAIQGVALPLEIKYVTVANEQFSIVFEDPEINVPFLEGVFAPNLTKLRMYPLSSLK